MPRSICTVLLARVRRIVRPEATTAHQTSKLRWQVAALLFSASVINYVDRQTLSVLAPYVSESLQLSNVDCVNIVLAFLVPYTLMYPISGILIDKLGTRVSLAISLTWWSVANGLHTTARSALSLGFFRFLLDVGESANFLAAEKAISEWYPPSERGVANGLVSAAAATGAVLLPPLVIWIYSHFGWRPAFVITALLGVVWLIFWLRLYNVPQSTRAFRQRIGLDRGRNRRKTRHTGRTCDKVVFPAAIRADLGAFLGPGIR